MVGCVSNGRLHQQWECTSVGAECLGNDGRLSPKELHRPGFSCACTRSVWNRCYLLSHCATPNAVSLESPGLAHCPSSVQSQVQPSQVSDSWFNRAPGPVRFVWSTVECRCATVLTAGCTSCRLHQPKPLPGILHLFYTWEFPRSVGNKDPSGNAALNHPPRVHRELQS